MKPFITTIISTEEQEVYIKPSPEYDCIIIETKEVDGSPNNKMYLNKDEAETLIAKIQDMIKYLEL